MTVTVTDAGQPQLYLIRWGNYVKVGCSVDPLDRLIRVTARGRRPPKQTGQPELLGSVPGSFGAEAWMHAALAGQHAVGEWFHLRGPVADLVDVVTRAGTLPSRREPERIPADGELHAAVTNRGPEAEANRRRHALPAGATKAVCGAAVSIQLGPWDPSHRRACVSCRGALP